MATFGISARWFTTAVLLLILLEPIQAADAPTALNRAAVTVERARRQLQPRREPTEILAVLEAAAARLDAISAPERPTLLPVDPEAGEVGSAKTAVENKRRLRGWRRARDEYRVRSERLRTRWVRVLGTALTLRRTEGGSLDNVHHAVNRRALALLVETGRSDAAKAILRALEGEWLKPYRLTAERPMALHALEALHGLRSEEAYEWLRRTFVGKERDLIPSVPTSHLRRAKDLDLHPHDIPVHALQAIARHEQMPGRLRHLMVRDLLAAYAPLERRAAHGLDVERWARLRIAVLSATLRQAGDPMDEAGDALTTMASLAKWFKGHRSPRDAHWAD